MTNLSIVNIRSYKLIILLSFSFMLFACGNLNAPESIQSSYGKIINEALRHESNGDLGKVSEILSTIDYVELEGENLKNYLYLKKKSDKIFTNDTEINNINIEHKGDFIYAKGYVKNIGSMDLKYVKLKVSFLDTQGNIIDSNWSYVNGSEILQPSEQKSFEIMTKYRDGIVSTNIEVVDFKK